MCEYRMEPDPPPSLADVERVEREIKSGTWPPLLPTSPSLQPPYMAAGYGDAETGGEYPRVFNPDGAIVRHATGASFKMPPPPGQDINGDHGPKCCCLACVNARRPAEQPRGVTIAELRELLKPPTSAAVPEGGELFDYEFVRTWAAIAALAFAVAAFAVSCYNAWSSHAP